jgi:hypothetical protein
MLKKSSFYQIALIILIIYNKNFSYADSSSKFINLVVDDSLYYPINLLVNQFSQKKEVIFNIKYVNNSFYKNLSYDDKVNIFITQKNNKNVIEKFFNIKESNFIGVTTYCICVNRDSELGELQIKSLEDLEKNNLVKKIGLGGSKSSFFLNRKFHYTRNTVEYFDSLSAMKDLYLKKYDIGVFIYPMCVKQKKFLPIYIIDSLDTKNKNQFMVDYRIFIVNHISNQVESFFAFLNNTSEINDLLKDYGIIGKSRQFSQN